MCKRGFMGLVSWAFYLFNRNLKSFNTEVHMAYNLHLHWKSTDIEILAHIWVGTWNDLPWITSAAPLLAHFWLLFLSITASPKYFPIDQPPGKLPTRSRNYKISECVLIVSGDVGITERRKDQMCQRDLVIIVWRLLINDYCLPYQKFARNRNTAFIVINIGRINGIRTI
jgi:hypothetical protein